MNLDLLDEVRDKALLKIATYQQKITNQHNKKLKPRVFYGDLVLRETEASDPTTLAS